MKSITTSDVRCAVLFTVVLEVYLCYAERDLLAIAKFLV